MKINMMNLDPYCFDQTQIGWRSLSEKRWTKAIEKYVKLYMTGNKFKTSVPANHINTYEHINYPATLLVWHLGQCYAFENKIDKAIRYLKLAKRFDEDGEHWNRYVDATIAFLKKDRETLNSVLDYQTKEENYNLHVLDSLDKNFNLNYKEAYSRGTM